MANLTKNLELLQTGKQKIIDKINSKLAEKDQKKLEVTCLWEEINELLAKIKIKKDRSEELDTSKIYSEICDDTRNRDIITNATSISSYSLYNQQYLPKLIANSCTSVSSYALYGCTALSVVELEKCSTIESFAFANTTSLKQISLPKLTSCGQYAFQNSGLETVSLDSVTTIDSYAFQEVKELTYVNAPKVVSVNTYAFYNDTKLKEVSTSTTGITVSSNAFYNCSSFDDETFISKVKSCGAYSFYNNAFLTINNDKLTTLSRADYCFMNCSKLESVTLENCTNINACQIFSSLPKLHSLNLPKVTILGRYNWNNYSDSAIHTCAELESLYLPELTQTYSLCYNCTNLTRISLPKLKYVYYDAAFITSCPKLEIIDMPEAERVNSYGITTGNDQGLFKNLYNLKTINLPKLLYTYSTGTTTSSNNNYSNQSLFYRCGMAGLNLPSFKYFNPYYCGFIVNDCRNLTTLELPQLEQVRSASNWGLQIVVGCPKLEVLELPMLTDIHAYRVFCCAARGYNSSRYTGYSSYYDQYQCKSYITTMLRAIEENYPSTFETITDYIQFYEYLNGGTTSAGLDTTDPYRSGQYSSISTNMTYSGLKVLKLPKLTSWNNGSYMIDSCTELEEIWLGDGTFAATSSLGSNFCYRCYNLKKIVLNYTSVVNATTSLLNIFSDSTYYLTGGRRSLSYNNKTYYYINELAEKSFKIYVPDDLVDAYKAASNWATYADNIFPISDLAGKTIDPSITAIADNEFKDDTTLTNIVGLGIESIGKYSFANSSLTWAEFAHCYSVDDYAFANATELSRLVLRYNDITTIGKGAFMNTKLSNMVLNKLGIVSDELFNNCAMLASVSLPVAKIVGKNSFENSGLTSITLPEALKIDNQAFNNCSMLNSITLNKATIIGESAFENTGIATLSLPLVTTIQRTAFKNSALTTVDIPKIMIIGDEAFANNTSLTTINLYEAMQIGSNVFDGCTALTDITFTGYTVPVCGNLPENCTLHVRTEVVDDYKLTFPNNVVVGDVA